MEDVMKTEGKENDLPLDIAIQQIKELDHARTIDPPAVRESLYKASPWQQ